MPDNTQTDSKKASSDRTDWDDTAFDVLVSGIQKSYAI